MIETNGVKYLDVRTREGASDMRKFIMDHVYPDMEEDEAGEYLTDFLAKITDFKEQAIPVVLKYIETQSDNIFERDSLVFELLRQTILYYLARNDALIDPLVKQKLKESLKEAFDGMLKKV